MITLDVGTRSIVCAEHELGVIARLEHAEHGVTCMKEGHVFDQPALVASVRAVRERMNLLEGTEAGIAIAGGQLATRRYTISLESTARWTESDLAAADAAALEKAVKAKGLADKWLLGVMRTDFKRDGRPVGSLIGLDGRAEYALLAAFLPAEHVRAKIAAITEAGFVPARIAVEPLAVSTALFGPALPPDVFAVIDIGAGTSDIAVFSPKGIVGAASVPSAGDRITESIAVKLGLSAMDADRVKRDPTTTMRDLWGNARTFDAAEVKSAGDDGARRVVAAVASELKKLLAGSEPISGVILVGGGSLWPSLAPMLADAMQLPASRVGVRTAETIPAIEDRTGTLKGPSYLTCLGMILSAPFAFRVSSFSVNGRKLVHVSRDGALTIAGAVTLAGEDPLDYFGDPGRRIERDGAMIGGEPGGDPRISVNGQPAMLDTPLGAASTIAIKKGERGADANPEMKVTSNEERVEGRGTRDENRVEEQVTSNEQRVTSNEGRVEEKPTVNVEPALVPLSTLVNLPIARSLSVRVNGIERTIADRTRSAIVEGKRVSGSTLIARSAAIDTARPDWRLYELFADDHHSLLVTRYSLLTVNGRPADLLTVIRAGDEVTL